MDIAIVHHADSPLGLSIARKLVLSGFRVYGFGQDFSHCAFSHKDFVHCAFDASKPVELLEKLTEILSKHSTLDYLVLVSRLGAGSPESLLTKNPQSLLEAARDGLELPLLLTQKALPCLLKGQSSIIHVHERVSGVISAREDFFQNLQIHLCSLFESHRNEGLKLSEILLEHAVYGEARDYTDPAQINPDLVAQTVENLLRFPVSNNISQIRIEPQASSAAHSLPKSKSTGTSKTPFPVLPGKEDFPADQPSIDTPRKDGDFRTKERLEMLLDLLAQSVHTLAEHEELEEEEEVAVSRPKHNPSERRQSRSKARSRKSKQPQEASAKPAKIESEVEKPKKPRRKPASRTSKEEKKAEGPQGGKAVKVEAQSVAESAKPKTKRAPRKQTVKPKAEVTKF